MKIICSIFWNSQTMFGARASYGRGLNVGNFHTDGINYPTSPIIRRQRYLNAPPSRLGDTFEIFWFVWTPDMTRRQPFGCMGDNSWWSRNTTMSVAFITSSSLAKITQTFWPQTYPDILAEASFECNKKHCFQKWIRPNPPSISLGVSLKESKRVFDFDKV